MSGILSLRHRLSRFVAGLAFLHFEVLQGGFGDFGNLGFRKIIFHLHV